MATPPPLPAPATSLLARMFNIFATPGEVFDEVKYARPSPANWLAPVLLSILAGAISVLIIFSQPAVLQQMHEQQTKAFEERVNSGKMTRAQADQAEAVVGKFGGPALFKFTGIIGVLIMTFIRVFWWALVLWLLAKWFLKTKIAFDKSLEVAGLAFMVQFLGSIVGALLSVMAGKVSSLSLALLAPNADPRSLLHLCLAAVDLFNLWLVGVMAVGLSRLTGAPWSKALALTFGYWLVMTSVLVSFGWLAIYLSTAFNK